MKNIQPINEGQVNDALSEPVAQPQPVTQPVPKIDNIYPPAPPVPSSNFENSDDTSQQHPYAGNVPSRSKSKTIIISLVSLLLFTGIILATFLFLRQERTTQNTSKDSQQTQATGGIEKKLNASQLEQLNQISMPLYLPTNLKAEKISLINSKSTGKTFFTYSHNLKFGRGLLKGTYKFSIYPVSDTFKPPQDCALVGGAKASSPLDCPFYEGSNRDLPAYIYTGHNPFNIQDTEGGSPIEMYARNEDVIIVVATQSTEPSELYNIIKNMKKVNPIDLPEDTAIEFTE